MTRGTLNAGRRAPAHARNSAAVIDAPGSSSIAAPIVLTQLRVRHGETHGLAHGGMREQDLVDLARRDLLAAAVDQLLQAARQPQIAVVVEATLIAGAKPAVGETPRHWRPDCFRTPA